MFTPEQFPSENAPEEKQSNPTEGKEASSHPTLAVPRSSGKHGIATENEGVKSLKEDAGNLATYDALHYHVFKLWSTFGTWNNRQILKNISASPQILRTYHDSFLFGKVPMSAKARTILRTGHVGNIWTMLEFTFALLSGVLYVISTYRPTTHGNWDLRVQDAISVAFLVDYVLRIYCEPVRLYFIFSFWGVVDLLSFIPIILLFRSHIEGYNFLRLLQFVRVIRAYHFTNKVGTFGSSVTQQITLLTISTCGVIFVIAGVLQWVEYHLASPAKRLAESCTEQGCITFWESMYFLVVTVSTVGYGDITPSTMIGQLVAIVTIIGALTILPIQIGRITSLAYRRPYGGSFSANKIIGSRFLIISGSITFATVQNFLSEFYNPTHSEDLEIYPLRVIILAPFSPSFELKQVLCLYKGLVEFIEGSPVRQSDLERVSAAKAAAFFLLADSEAENTAVEDAAQVVRALAVHRFCTPANRYKRRVRIIVEVLDPETHTSAVWDDALTGGIEVICPVKVHYKMMARSCVVHGLYTLITNLFTSELQLKYLNRRHFLTEYFHSFDNEVYPVILPEAFHGLGFEAVVDFIFIHFNSILFAVDTSKEFKSAGKELDHEVLLFPKGHIIDADDVGLVISADLHTAYAISTYRPTEDGVNCLRELWAKATKIPQMRRHNEGTELLDPTSGRWRRSSSSVAKSLDEAQSIGPRSAVFGVKGPTSYPRDPKNNRKLEYELRSAIQNVYTAQQYPDWVQQQPRIGGISFKRETSSHAQGLESGRVEEGDVKSGGTGGGEKVYTSHRFPKGISLEKAAQDLLAWPPLSCTDRPHPAVIEDKEDVIIRHLKEKTITMVAFDVPHILVCCQIGWPKHFFYFLLELRREGLSHPPVVMLHPGKISAKEWGYVGVFKDVYFMKGSPLYELDLLRGGVLQAEKIVILSDHGVPVDLQGDGFQNKYLKRTPAAYTSDVENIIIAANVQRLYGHSVSDNVIVEMQHTEAFFYLRPQYEISRAHFPSEGVKRSRDALVHFGPPFMEGKAICSSMLGFLMRSSFYNRNTQTLVDQLIQGGYKKEDGGEHMEHHKSLDQVRVPEQYANKPFSELFLGLLREQGVLAIGLYRIRGNLGAPTSYVLTNPYPDCTVNFDDLVYVIH